MRLKPLLAVLPLSVVLGAVGLSIAQWHAIQSNRPDYDNAAAALPKGQSQNTESVLATVIAVHDGDTLTALVGSQKVRVRLCGIDAPELAQPLGPKSRNYLRSQLPSNQPVMLFMSDTDRYGRIVAEVFVSAPTPQQPEQEKHVNYELVRAGLAYRYPQHADQCPNGRVLASAENEAKSNRLGVWSNPNAVKPWAYRRTTE